MIAVTLLVLAVGLALLAGALRRALSEARGGRARRRIGGVQGGATFAVRVPVRVEEALLRAAVPGPPARWWTAWCGAVVVAGAVGLLTAGPGAAVLLVAVTVMGPAAALHLTRERAAAAVERGVPLLLEEAARKLRAGADLGVALVTAGRSGACLDAPGLGDDMAHLGRSLEHGEALAAAIEAWAVARPLPGVQLAAAALRLAAEQGGAQAQAVDGVAATLRQRLEQAAEVRAATAQARASVAVLGAAPLAFALVALLLDPGTARAALTSAGGLASVGAGLALDLAAVAWMNRLTRGVR